MTAGQLIKQARREAGLTQKQLAARLRITQAAVAQLESGRTNPTLATLERTLDAADHRLELRAVPAERQVDASLLREALRMTPAERIAAAEHLTREAEQIAAAAASSRRNRKRAAR